MLGVHIRLVSHRVTPSGQFGVPYKIYFLVENKSLQEITMDKCICEHCSKVYYNTPLNYSWYLCPTCMDIWFLFGCPVE